MTAAPAGRPGHLLDAWPRQRRVAPFAGDPMAALDDAAIHDDAAAATGAEDHAEDHPAAAARTVRGFRQSEAIGIVLHPHVSAQQRCEVGIQPVAVQRGRVGILDQSGRGADHPGNADPYGCDYAQFPFGVAHQAGDRRQLCRIGLRRGDPPAQHQRPVRAEDADLDLGPSEVDADAMLGHAVSMAAVTGLLKGGVAQRPGCSR